MVISFLSSAIGGKRLPSYADAFPGDVKPASPEDADPEAMLAIVEQLNAAFGGIENRKGREVN